MTTAKILKMPKPLTRLQCSKCGATANASCDCGVAYLPAGEIAERALKANPEKSNAIIAAETGVAKSTLHFVRNKLADQNCTPAKVIGRDGKTYPTKYRPRPPDPNQQPEPRWQRSVSNLAGDIVSIRAFWSKEFGEQWKKFDVPSDLLKLILQASKEWTEFVNQVQRRKS